MIPAVRAEALCYDIPGRPMNTNEGEFEDNLDVVRALLDQNEDSEDFLEANELVNRALALRPGDASAWILKAQVLSALDDDFAALAAIEMALQRRPDLAEAHYWRAAVLTDLDRHEDALTAIERAFTHVGQNRGQGVDDDWLLEELYYEKALIEEALGHNEQAIATFREGLERCPDSPALESLERARRRAAFKVIPGGRAP